MYSMESFLYKRLNKVAREKLESSVTTLGPFAALISRIIDKRTKSDNRSKIYGELTVFRGLSLPDNIVEKWKRKSYITLDGYSSSSLSANIAYQFAIDGS